MLVNPIDGPEQEQSIKERGSELYAKAKRERPKVKPFEVYLRETPAAPTSGGVKALLWITGIVVALVFAAALWKVTHRRPRSNPARAPRQAAWMIPGGLVHPGLAGPASSGYDQGLEHRPFTNRGTGDPS
jgi:hypothetical protein